MKKRWKFTPAGKYAILSRALHEVIHMEIGPHNEDYANRLTDLCGVVLYKVGQLRKAF